MRPAIEVADIFRRCGPQYRQTHAEGLSRAQRRVMSAIELCRTAALGAHLEQCNTCSHQRITYNSCRHRACPKCQSLARAQWLERRRAELLSSVEYFHVVFTLPESIAALALQNKKTLYDLLFRASAETLRTIAADPKHLGAEIGFITILHTWGQNLLHHPHVHCVVPGGGIAPDGERWIACRPGFFLPVRVLSRLFRRLFLGQLRRAFDAGALRFHGQLEPLRDPRAFAAWLAPAAHADWVVYAKPPFGGAEHVLDYLGRYTHRVAISNNRLLAFDERTVQFRWKDYRHEARQRTMTLTAHEFIRRFLLHVLPEGFRHIRSYGWMANCHRSDRLATCRQLLGVEAPAAASAEPSEDYRDRYQRLTGKSLRDCPVCGTGHMLRIESMPGSLPRAPPASVHAH
ncbi:transposase-like zinc-binding protein [Paraburkholderia sp. BL27I4N3]|uniref:IS91 family transposase n=1 Tax=Paraburkholderia sp. BL27I4N3 TaxID=1938805 RepID=UPI000E26CBF0|nr:IS91 family transposase [Paraburkholderia sp. BL27I4N3]REE21559.1 transposase-like zinc-binding protein [Paraburkholderia sp. BL27I4N3]REE23544.1 transposase-like zinc-binding protein [Paraburkholderia sp. BL27I4N3]